MPCWQAAGLRLLVAGKPRNACAYAALYNGKKTHKNKHKEKQENKNKKQKQQEKNLKNRKQVDAHNVHSEIQIYAFGGARWYPGSVGLGGVKRHCATCIPSTLSLSVVVTGQS